VLESTDVTAGLHHWIDLIFGYQSRGEAAVEAKNLYHPLCYAGESRADFGDAVDREASISRILNFGQCAQMLFRTPHPQSQRSARAHLMSNPSAIGLHRITDRQFASPITDLGIAGGTVVAIDREGSVLLPPTFGFSLVYAIDQGVFATASTQSLRGKASGSPILRWQTDQIPRIKITPDGAVLGIHHSNGLLMLYWLEYEHGEVAGATPFVWLPDFADVADFAISLPHFLCVVVTSDAIVLLDIGRRTETLRLVWQKKVNCVATDDRSAEFIVAMDSEITVFSINGDVIVSGAIEYAATVVAVPDLEEAIPNRFFASGHVNGSVRFWSLEIAQQKLTCHSIIDIAKGSISHIAFDEECQRAAVSSNVELFMLEFRGSTVHS
jgi:hypothetical protein